MGLKLNEEEHENSERWMLTYLDLITLLMIFFIVMYAMSNVDAAKYELLSNSLNSALAGDKQSIEGGEEGSLTETLAKNPPSGASEDLAATSEQDLAQMAGKFLRILLLGAPGYALFEVGRRFVQAQGLFHAPLLVMLFGLPINLVLNWLFVFKLDWGFTGAALALSLTRDILPVLLLVYVLLIKPSSLKCWGGFGKSTFKDWGLMIKLSVPGIFMVEAEWFAFELLTLAASYLSATDLAAQSVVMTVCVVMAHVPFSIAVAVSTRLGNLIGSGEVYAAKVATRAYCIAAVVIGLSDGLFLALLRKPILKMFTEDEAVTGIAFQVIPVLATYQLFDSTTAVVNGLLRGIGRQSTGAWINLIVYYLVSYRTFRDLLLSSIPS